MDGSPRASKRRKLDSAVQKAPSTPAEPSGVRKSARTTTRTTFKADGTLKQRGTISKTAPKPSLNKLNGARRQQDTKDDADVWDDIEGALGESSGQQSAPKPSESAKRRPSRKITVDEAPNKRIGIEEPPKIRASGRNTNRSTLKSRAGGLGDIKEADIEEDHHAEVSTSSRRTSKRATQDGPSKLHKGATEKPFKPGSLRKPRSTTQANALSEEADTLILATPSSRRRRQQARVQDKETIPEIGSEPSKHQSSAPRSKSARRGENRTDDQQAYSHVSDAIDEGDGAMDADEADEDGLSIDGNSVLGSVLDPTEPSPFNKPPSGPKSSSNLPTFTVFTDSGREPDLLRSIVLERIHGKRHVPLIALDDAYNSVHQLVEHTVAAGEGNSMLLIGARGSGKTALVNKVLTEVSKDNGNDYHVVRLNGFIHTDDKIALREIWRQLGKEMELEEESGGVGKNYADTLTTLLALLSHPSEHTGEYTEQVAKAVVFIMDEFDLFAQHPRQTLLYNLFDIAQSRKAPIAVLGLTTRIDVANSLEKRVKSRFSHRYVHLSLAKTFTAFQEICKANLLIQPEYLTVEERSILDSASKKVVGKTKSPSTFLSQWNSDINALFLSKSFLTTHLAPLFYLSKSIPTTLTTFLLPTASSTSTFSVPSLSLTTPPDSKLSLVPHLSTLALSLLIAACRLDIIHDSDTCNFNMAYDEYVTLASRARVQSAAGGSSTSGAVSKVWGRAVARKEWEELVEWGLVMPVLVGGGVAGTGVFGMCRCDVSLEEVGVVLAGIKGEKGLERWCKHI